MLFTLHLKGIWNKGIWKCILKRPSLQDWPFSAEVCFGLRCDGGEHFGHLGADVGGAVHHVDAAIAHHALLRFGRLVFAGNDRARVAHGAALGCRDACDEADDRLGAVRLNPTRRLHLEVTADLADHHDALRFVVRHEELDRFEGGGANDGVTADADGRGLAEASLGALVHGLVREGARLGHDTNNAGLEDEAWHDPHFCLARRNDARAVGTNQGAVALVDVGLHLDHVCDGNALGDGDDDLDAGVRRFHQGVGCKRRRHKHNAHVRTRLCDRIRDRVEHGAVEVGLASLPWRHAANNVGAVFNHLACVEGAFASGEALDDDFGVAVDENAHVVWVGVCGD